MKKLGEGREEKESEGVSGGLGSVGGGIIGRRWRGSRRTLGEES